MEELSSNAAEAEAGQREKGAIRQGTMRVAEHIPRAEVAPALHIPLLAHLTWANRYHKPSAECNHLIGDRRGHNISPASVSANNPDNDPMPSKKELLVEAAEDDCERPGQGTASMKKMSICKHSYEASVAAPMSELVRQSDKIVNKADKSTLTPCSP
jgi:hypothetical protein